MNRASLCLVVGFWVMALTGREAAAQQTPPPDPAPPGSAEPADPGGEPPTSTEPPTGAEPPAPGTTPPPAQPAPTVVTPPVRSTESFVFGTPKEHLAFASSGYSGVLRGGYMAPLGDAFAIGGEFILDAGLFHSVGEGVPGTVTIAAGAPMKFTFLNNDQMILGLTATPGLGVTVFDLGPLGNEALFALLLHAQGNFGYKLNPDFIVGGGVEVPLTFLFGEINLYLFPLLFGPTAEYNLTDQLSLSADLKLGPHIATGDNAQSETTFGFKAQVGAAYIF